MDDVVETANHFRCIDLVIENAAKPLTEAFIKELHRTLKSGTSDSRQPWFAVGAYKKVANEVGGQATTLPSQVPAAMAKKQHHLGFVSLLLAFPWYPSDC